MAWEIFRRQKRTLNQIRRQALLEARLSRCSREQPCEKRNPLHLVVWGECFHLDNAP